MVLGGVFTCFAWFSGPTGPDLVDLVWFGGRGVADELDCGQRNQQEEAGTALGLGFHDVFASFQLENHRKSMKSVQESSEN